MDYKIKLTQTFIPYLIGLIIMVGGIVYLDQLSGSFTSEVETIVLQASEGSENVFLWQPEYIESIPETSFDKNRLFKNGLKSFENQEWDEARIYWNKFLINYPKAYQVWELLGRTYVENRQYLEAINAFKQSLALNRTYFPALVHMGNTNFAIQQFNKAELFYKEAAQHFPGSPIVHLNLGLVLARQQNWSLALDEFIKSSSFKDLSVREKSIYYEGLANLYLKDTVSALDKFQASMAINPSFIPPQIQEALLNKRNSSENKKHAIIKVAEDKGKVLKSFVYYNLANYFKNTGNFDEAEVFFLQALQANPEDKELKFALGKHYLEQNNFDQAEMLFKQMANLDQMMPRPYYYLAELESFKNNQKQAIALYEKAILISENMFPEAHLGKGISLEAINNLENAIQSYKQALAINPDYPEAFFQLGEAYLKKEELQLAVEAFGKSLDLKPGFAKSWYGLGKAYELLEEKNAALGAYENALTHDPQMFHARMAAATLHTKQNNYNAAVKGFKYVLQQNPNYLPALFQIGDAYARIGKHNEAIQAFEKIVKLRPYHVEAKEKLAELNAAQKNIKEAEKLYEELVKAIPFDHQLRYKLALQYEKQAKYKAAISQLEKALELEPGYQNASQLLESIRNQGNGTSAVAFESLIR